MVFKSGDVVYDLLLLYSWNELTCVCNWLCMAADGTTFMVSDGLLVEYAREQAISEHTVWSSC